MVVVVLSSASMGGPVGVGGAAIRVVVVFSTASMGGPVGVGGAVIAPQLTFHRWA